MISRTKSGGIMTPFYSWTRIGLVLGLVIFFLGISQFTPCRAEVVAMETARLQAASEFVVQVAAGAFVTAGWENARLGEPVVLYDPIWHPLYYEFPVLSGTRSVGFIKVAADSVLGTDVVSMERRSHDQSLEEMRGGAVEAFYAEMSGMEELLVVVPMTYRGLEMGFALVYHDPGSGYLGVRIFDADTSEHVPLDAVRSTYLELPEDQFEQRMEKWEYNTTYAHLLAESLAERMIDLEQLHLTAYTPNQWETAKNAVAQISQSIFKTVDLSRCKLYQQQNNIFCARACLQMFNHFHLGTPKHSQTVIDQILNSYGWTGGWENAFMKYLTVTTGLNGCYEIKVNKNTDYSFPWMDMTTEINANRPFAVHEEFVSLNTAHIMFAMAYELNEKEVFGGIVFTERWLGLYDPAGSVCMVKVWNDTILSYAQLKGYIVAAP